MKSFIVIRDTREKVGWWDFSFAPDCIEQVVQTVKTGDYTIKGYEDKIAIERKRTTGELAINLGAKWATFQKEMERIENYEHRYIICEFTIGDVLSFPASSNIPRKSWASLRMNGKFMLKRLQGIEDKYGVKVVFCDDKVGAEQAVLEIFRDVLKQD